MSSPIRQGVAMRQQRDRDEVTLTIARSLLLFLAVVGCGAVVLWIARTLVGDRGLAWANGMLAVAVLVGLAAIAYLYRHRRP